MEILIPQYTAELIQYTIPTGISSIGSALCNSQPDSGSITSRIFALDSLQ